MSVLLLAFGLLVFAACFYLAALSVLALLPQRPLPPEAETTRFTIVVPAHDEAGGIAQTVASLLALDYPADRRQVLVVADNCTDDTAALARTAGAEVIERTSQTERGKGYALAYGFAQAKGEAVVVVDADTLVEPGLLRAFARRLRAGEHAIQANYAVRNVTESWRTRLLSIAFALFHDVRSLGRERMRWSCGLRGNGMCFSRVALEKAPHEAYSVVEDLEHGLALGRAGIRVAYAHEARVRGEMPSGERQSRSQRRRWEGGRRQMRRQVGPKLTRDLLTRPSGMLFDLWLDLMVPPLSTLVLGWLTGAIASALWAPFALPVYAAAALCLMFYVVTGWRLSRTGAAGLSALFIAPLYVAWKIALVRRREPKKDEWVRTARKGEETR